MNYESLIPNYILQEQKQKILQQYELIDERNVNSDLIEMYVEMIQSDDIVKQHYGLVAIRKLISANQSLNLYETTQAIIEGNLVPILIHILGEQSNQLFIFEALWIITNIASGTNQQTQIIVQNGVIPNLLKHLNSTHQQILQQVFWALGNIAADNAEFRNNIIQQGGLSKFIEISEKLITESNNALVILCSWTLSNLSRGNSNQNIEKNKRQIIKYFAYIIDKFEDSEALGDACWGIQYISDCKNGFDSNQEIIDTGIVHRLIYLLKSNQQVSIIVPSLRIIKKILTGDTSQRDYVLNTEILDIFVYLLKEPNFKGLILEVCQCISHITERNYSQTMKVINNDQIIKTLFHIFQNETLEIKIGIAFVFSNALSHIKLNDILRLFHMGLLFIFEQTVIINGASIYQKIKIIQSSNFILENVSSVRDMPKSRIMESLKIFEQNNDEENEDVIKCKQEYFTKWQNFINN